MSFGILQTKKRRRWRWRRRRRRRGQRERRRRRIYHVATSCISSVAHLRLWQFWQSAFWPGACRHTGGILKKFGNSCRRPSSKRRQRQGPLVLLLAPAPLVAVDLVVEQGCRRLLVSEKVHELCQVRIPLHVLHPALGVLLLLLLRLLLFCPAPLLRGEAVGGGQPGEAVEFLEPALHVASVLQKLARRQDGGPRRVEQNGERRDGVSLGHRRSGGSGSGRGGVRLVVPSQGAARRVTDAEERALHALVTRSGRRFVTTSRVGDPSTVLDLVSFPPSLLALLLREHRCRRGWCTGNGQRQQLRAVKQGGDEEGKDVC
mmetsp:Transcript_26974/g.55185  ORF Transcript_26974/g.55185 Transcript_26974/m.55185 type:complete len:317 (+) Transcript_26974:218-1168(+)